MAKPLVLICSTPVSGHIIPMRTIAKGLAARGYVVYFVSGSGYRQYVESIGACFVAVEGYGDFYDLRARDLDPEWPLVRDTLQGPENFAHDVVHVFCRSIPSQHQAIQKALETMEEAHQGQPVILLTESLNFGALPIALGAPGRRPAAFMAIGLNPILLTSVSHPPFGLGLLPDDSANGRKRNVSMNRTHKEVFEPAQTAFEEGVEEVGGFSPDTFLLDALYSLPDRFVQMCAPSLEYPRSDAPKTIRFAGGYPRDDQTSTFVRPTWWSEVISKRDQRIVFVCQGTVARDLRQLALPTMVALRDRPDILVVVSLGVRGHSLPSDFDVPTNARVADYIPYDDILPHCDLFVTTGGYGSLQRSLIHGVPLIMAAMSEEKPESAARGEWAGVALNLRTSEPSLSRLHRSVDQILRNDIFKQRAKAIRDEIASYDPVGVIAENIEDLASRA